MSQSQKIRQLAAIVFVDMVGYTALMQENERLAIEKRNRHRDSLEIHTANHNGKILQFFGDGALLIFNSAVEATKAMINLQRDMTEKILPSPAVWEYIWEIFAYSETDAVGDGVNIASRIESFAVPGSVLVSDKIQKELINHPDIQAVSMGLYNLKNVEEPVEVFAIEEEHLVTPDHTSLRGKGSRHRKSLTKKNSYSGISDTSIIQQL